MLGPKIPKRKTKLKKTKHTASPVPALHQVTKEHRKNHIWMGKKKKLNTDINKKSLITDQWQKIKDWINKGLAFRTYIIKNEKGKNYGHSWTEITKITGKKDTRKYW